MPDPGVSGDRATLEMLEIQQIAATNPGVYETVVIANRSLREVYRDEKNQLQTKPPGAGGLVTATDKVKKAWVFGWPGLNVEESDTQTRQHIADLLLPYNTTPVHLTHEEYRAHYLDFCNQVLWFLLHGDSQQMAALFKNKIGNTATERKQIFEDFRTYVVVNDRFAKTIVAWLEKQENPKKILWIHDYQLMLLPGQLRAYIAQSKLLANTHVPIGYFLHIPFPGPDVFQDALQYGLTKLHLRSILLGLLGSDQIGFHTEGYRQNFLQTVERFNQDLALSVTVNLTEGTIKQGERTIRVGAFPIGIDYATYAPKPEQDKKFSTDDQRELEAFQKFHKINTAEGKVTSTGPKIILSVERLDPIKAIYEKLLAFERLLVQNPALINDISYECIVVPSRTGVPANDELAQKIKDTAARINNRYRSENFPQGPVRLVQRAIKTNVLCEFYRMADIINGASHHDGMNLVVKEFIAAQLSGGTGAVILGKIMGATHHFENHNGIDRCFVVNSAVVNADGSINEQALDLYVQQLGCAVQRCRTASVRDDIQVLQRIVKGHSDVHQWAKTFLTSVMQALEMNEAMCAKESAVTTVAVPEQQSVVEHEKGQVHSSMARKIISHIAPIIRPASSPDIVAHNSSHIQLVRNRSRL